MSLLNPIFEVLGRFLMWLYTTTGSYVLALVIFTLLIKLVLFPFSIKSKRSMMKTQAVQGKMQQLQKQYGKDQERYSMEVSKLYSDEGINPLGGCLWSLLPLPILWGVYAIVRRPLAFMYGLESDQITAVKEAVEGVVGELSSSTLYAEVQVADLFHTNADAFEAAKAALGDAASSISTTINYSFLGINLSQTPQLKFWSNGLTWASVGLFLLPVIMAGVAFLSSSVTQRTNKINQNDSASNAAADSTMRSMLIMMPLMYIWFGFIMPAAMCIYMLISCLLQMLQEILASKMLRSKFMEAQAAKEEAERQRKLEERRARQEKIEQRQREAEEARKQRKKTLSTAKKDDAPKTDKGGIGIRRYALGRNYEPDRYGGVTPYHNPNDIVDEAALEAALAKKKKK